MPFYICQLPDESLLHLRGKNIPAFLQGQLTCDTRGLGSANAVPGALCSAKGRVLSDVLLQEQGEDHCTLRLRRSVAAAVAQVLSRYAQFSRISVEEEPSVDRLYGIYGQLPENIALTPDANGAVQLASIPIAVDKVSSALNHRVSITRRSEHTAEVRLHEDVQANFVLGEEAAKQGAQGAWQGELLRAGHYAIDVESLEKYTPQALNYDLTGLVSFKKGCYTGQEVVARLHYKGKSKKRLGVYLSASGEAENNAASIEIDDSLHLPETDVTTSPRAGKVLRVGVTSEPGLSSAAEVQADAITLPLVTSSGLKLIPLGRETNRSELP
ncbi:MAG: folate-binding protein [Pseudomonadota bacterium]